MAADPSDNPKLAGSLEYASANRYRPSSLVTLVAILSLCVASVSLLSNGFLLKNAINEISATRNLPAQMQQAATVRAQTLARLAAANNSATRPFHARALTPGEISNVIQLIDNQLGAEVGGESLTASQKHTLRQLLSRDSQSIIDPSLPLVTRGGSPMQSVRARMENNRVLSLVVFHTKYTDLYRTRIDADGRELPMPAIRPIPSIPAPPAPTISTAQDKKLLRDRMAAASISAGIFSTNLILAILLLIGGLLFLRRDQRGARLHWIYLLGKLPISILASTEFLTNYFDIEYTLQFPLGTPLAIVGCFYPIALIILLRTRTFRGNARGGTPGYLNFALDDPRPPLFTIIATASICIACLSLLVNGMYEYGAITMISQSKQDRADEQGQFATNAARVAAANRAIVHHSTPLRALRHGEIEQVVAMIQSQLQTRNSPASLTKPQGDALTAMLSTDGQELIDPSIPLGVQQSSMKYQWARAAIDFHGNLVLSFHRGSPAAGVCTYSMQLDSSGKLVGMPQFDSPATIGTSSAAAMLPPDRQQYYDRENACAWAGAIVFGLDFVPAIILLVGARQLFKSNLSGIQSNWIYIWAKFTTAVIGGAVVACWASLYDSDVPGIVLIALVPSFLALIYPAALLAALGSARKQAEAYLPYVAAE
jgi:hypothetical protein